MTETTPEPLWKQAFPEFDGMDFELPEGFVDSSWRNDACPSFMNAELDVALYAHYVNPAMRDVPESKRFVLLETVDGQYASSDNVLAVSDSFDEILAALQERRASLAPRIG